jgi:peptidoglycan/xylan/chitin deacetylase (PgdA/CDA1 family)
VSLRSEDWTPFNRAVRPHDEEESRWGRSVARALPFVPIVLLAAHVAPANRLGRSLLPVITRLRTDSAVALTFDDGPDRGLDMFLDLLEKAKARATFFVVGEQVERAPSKLQEIASCGHEIAVHGYRHRNHLFMTPRQTVEDMRRAKEVIEEAAGCPAKLFRAPYGRFTLTSCLEASRQGWQSVHFTRARVAHDWEAQATPRSVVDNVGFPEAGDILLLHDSDRYTAPGSWRVNLNALPIILERLSDLGLRVSSVGDLLDAEARERY